MADILMFSPMDSVLSHWRDVLKDEYVYKTYKSEAKFINALNQYPNVGFIFIDDTHVKDIFKLVEEIKTIFFGRVFLFHSVPNVYHASRLLVKHIDGYENTFIAKENLLKAIEAIQNGKCWFFEELAYFIIDRYMQQHKRDEPEFMQLLTDKEKEIALMVADGLTNKEIAVQQKNAVSTIKNHVKSIFEKAQVTNRVALTLKFQS